jgi:hypothetical protein
MFFVIDAENVEDLWRWFASLFDVAKSEIKPVVSFELLVKIFEEPQKTPVIVTE